MRVLEAFLLRLDVDCYNLLLSVVEFTQGMILPTANGVTKQQTAQATTKTSKTQVSLEVSFLQKSMCVHYTVVPKRIWTPL